MTESSFILAIDQGTTSSRAILFSGKGEIIAKHSIPFKQYYPQPGWVEHDPEEIWDTVYRCCQDVLKAGSVSPEQVAAIGITNQRETAVIWETETGKALHPAIVWQSRQSAEICSRLKNQGYEKTVREKTGLVIDAYFSASKLTWLFEKNPELKTRAINGEVKFGTVDSWLLWKLTAGHCHATDISNASRTLLYNIHTCSWDPELCEIFSVPAQCLPEVRPSSGIFDYCDEKLFGASIPVSGIAGDQQAALFGQTCFKEGMAKNTYGTGCFVLMNTGKRAVPSNNGLLTTVAWDIGEGPVYALEGSIFIAGAAIEWLKTGLEVISTPAEADTVACEIKTHLGVYVVPAFVGLGTPHWDSDARGAIFGLTRGTSWQHIVRATVESLAFQSYDVLGAMIEDTGTSVTSLRVDGGAAKSNFLMEFQASLLNTEVVRSAIHETTALGACYLAGLAAGVWNSTSEIADLWKHDAVFKPSISSDLRVLRLKEWTAAVTATRTFKT